MAPTGFIPVEPRLSAIEGTSLFPSARKAAGQTEVLDCRHTRSILSLCRDGGDDLQLHRRKAGGGFGEKDDCLTISSEQASAGDSERAEDVPF